MTIEANPEDISRESVSAWMLVGVNRLSLGIQTFDDRVLQWMHRVHSASDAARAIETVRDAGIANFSLDLIFALPNELERSGKPISTQAFAFAPPHVSLYGLTIEPATPLARWKAAGAVNPGD